MFKKVFILTLSLLITCFTIAFAEQGWENTPEQTNTHFQAHDTSVKPQVKTEEINASTLNYEEQRAAWLGYLASYAAYVGNPNDTDPAGKALHDLQAFNKLKDPESKGGFGFADLQTITLPETNWYNTKVKPTYSIGSNNHYYIVAFRGTNMANGMNPLLADAPALAVEFEKTGTKVHAGFYNYMLFMKRDKALKDFVAKALADKDPSAKLLVTGTSLGGATAVLYAAYLVETYNVPQEKMIVAVTADPAAGDINFCERYNTKINCINIIRQDDIVPVITEMFSFGHFGRTFVEQSSPQNYHDADLWLEHYADTAYIPFLEFLTPNFDKKGFKLGQ